MRVAAATLTALHLSRRTGKLEAHCAATPLLQLTTLKLNHSSSTILPSTLLPTLEQFRYVLPQDP